jgi:hypothetical protein
MESLNYYSLKKAAAILQEPEEKVLDYIRSGRLKAQFLTNIMDYIITHEDLMSFLKQKKDFGTMRKVLTHRVVIVDRDLKIQDVCKLDLARKQIQVRVATTDREVQLLIDDFLPDVLAVNLGATTRTVDPIRGAIEKAKAAKRILIVYHNLLESSLQEKPEIQAHIQRLGPDYTVNISRGLSSLLDTIKKALGVR